MSSGPVPNGDATPPTAVVNRPERRAGIREPDLPAAEPASDRGALTVPADAETPTMLAAEGRAGARNRWLGPALAAALFGAAMVALQHELREFHYGDVRRSLRAIPSMQIGIALALTALSYAVLAGYDALALRYVQHPLARWRIAFGSFVTYAISHTLGFPVLTGGAVRFRFWSAWGLSTAEIAQAASFAGATFTLGLVLMGGLVLTLEPAGKMALVHLPPAARALGAAALLVVAAYVAWSTRRRDAIRIGGWSFPMPTPPLAVAQLALAAVDWVVAAGVLYALLPTQGPAVVAGGMPFSLLLGAFLIAQLAGIISHVPGGIGVFEWVIVRLVRPYVQDEALIFGALLAYRAVYYLVPFAGALAALAVHETRHVQARLAGGVVQGARLVGRLAPRVVPVTLSFATFAAGAILLVSGATPSVHTRVTALDRALPLGVIEVSHFAASVAGAVLLVVAWALRRRLDAAWGIAVAALAVGMVTSVLKGLDYEEALVLAGVLALLVPARGAFHRRAALTNEPFTPGWTLAVALVVGVSVWLGLFSFKHVDYSHELWWQFEARADAPRALRASVGVVLGLLFFAVMRLLRHATSDPTPPTADELAQARAVVRDTPSTEAALALLGDKSLLFSDSGRSFVMYGVAGRSWVALGDPVGPPEEHAELAWRFKEAADEHGGWTVFYQAGVDRLPLYIDLGLTLIKLGEEARVPLDRFSLDGGARKGMRRVVNAIDKGGARFEVVDAAAVPALLPELRRISDDWLARKRVREKGFSLGYFDDRYLREFPIALVHQRGPDGERPVAFANLWSSASRQELSVDLMRYASDAPENVMEYLFVQLLLWGRAQGYADFNLGMAPLSGFDGHNLAPLWSRAGALIYRHGEHFYNFQGLRRYKEKFDPVWEPKYLASPGGLVLPRVLANVTSLISGGLRGVIAR